MGIDIAEASEREFVNALEALAAKE